ncbi:hypothetical protein SVIOM342S_01483 [Streptomyces violaceorubidus]
MWWTASRDFSAPRPASAIGIGAGVRVGVEARSLQARPAGKGPSAVSCRMPAPRPLAWRVPRDASAPPLPPVLSGHVCRPCPVAHPGAGVRQRPVGASSRPRGRGSPAPWRREPLPGPGRFGGRLPGESAAPRSRTRPPGVPTRPARSPRGRRGGRRRRRGPRPPAAAAAAHPARGGPGPVGPSGVRPGPPGGRGHSPWPRLRAGRRPPGLVPVPPHGLPCTPARPGFRRRARPRRYEPRRPSAHVPGAGGAGCPRPGRGAR